MYQVMGRKLQSLLQDGLTQLAGCGLLTKLRSCVCFFATPNTQGASVGRAAKVLTLVVLRLRSLLLR